MSSKRIKLNDSLAHSECTACGKPGFSVKKFVGAHVSAAGGLWRSFDNCKNIGGSAIALFLKNQRKWESPALSAADVEKYLTTKRTFEFNTAMILPHGSYLVNLGNPDDEKREKSYSTFKDDLERCHRLQISLYNLHPGSTVGSCSIERSIKHIADCINAAHAEVPEVCVVLETMAGQGNTIGNKFKDLAEIISLVSDKSRIGVCIDTCHIFAAGYDLRSAEAYENTMANFEETVGFKYLRGVHLNDSKCGLGSCKDRHENIGKGEIGLNAFKYLMNDPRFDNIPMVLETPIIKEVGEVGTYKSEIELLLSLVETN